MTGSQTTPMPGEELKSDKMPGHWLLARLVLQSTCSAGTRHPATSFSLYLLVALLHGIVLACVFRLRIHKSQREERCVMTCSERITANSEVWRLGRSLSALSGAQSLLAPEVLLEHLPRPPRTLLSEDHRLRLRPGIGDVALVV